MTAQSFIREFLRVIPIIAIVVVIIEVVVANRLATTGHELYKADGVISAMRDENELLRQKVASASAITTIRVKAEELGMVPVQNVLSFTQADFSVALAAKTTAVRQ